MKILHNLCLHFARQDEEDGKKRKENHKTKVPKIPRTKRRIYGMNETYSMVPNNSAARLLTFKIFSLPTLLIWTFLKAY